MCVVNICLFQNKSLEKDVLKLNYALKCASMEIEGLKENGAFLKLHKQERDVVKNNFLLIRRQRTKISEGDF